MSFTENTQAIQDPTVGGGGGGGLTSFNGRTDPAVVPEIGDYNDLLLPLGDSAEIAVSGESNCTVSLPGWFSYQVFRAEAVRLSSVGYTGSLTFTGVGLKQLTLQFDNLPLNFGPGAFGNLVGFLNLNVGTEDGGGGIVSCQPVPCVGMFWQNGSVSGKKIVAGFNLPSMFNASAVGTLLWNLDGVAQRRFI